MMHGRFRSQPTLFERPRESRGFLPLILAALAGAKAIYGAVDANQKKKRNEGYIDQNAVLARKKLKTRQQEVRQNTTESLASRGLAQGGIRAAMAGSAPHSLGEAQVANNEKEFGLENTDLENQVNQANTENTNARTSAYIGAGLGLAKDAMGAYGAGQEMGAANIGNGSIADASAPGGFGTSAIRASITGVDDPTHWFGGIVGGGADPMTAPGSSWNRGTRVAGGEDNATFNVG